MHIHGYNSGGGAETVFNITRKNNFNTFNYSGFIKADNSEFDKPDIKFDFYSDFQKYLRVINYIFSFSNYFMLKKFLNQNQIDIIHLHGFIGALSPSILLAIKKVKKKKNFAVIQTMHEFHLVCPNSILYDYSKNEICEACLTKKIKYNVFLKKCDRRGRIFSILKGIRSLLANNIFNHYNIVDKIISPSEFIKDKLQEGNVSFKKNIVIRNPIVLFDQNEDSPKENIICFFGRFSKEKNLTFLIEAFDLWKEKQGNNFKLLLIGSGDNENEIKRVYFNCRYKNEIIFKPFLPQELLFQEIKKIKYYAMTSNWYENAPMGILESASLNAIPIVPNIGGMKELIEDVLQVGMTYESQNHESWCKSMDILEQNYEQYLSKLKENKKKLIDQFSEKSYLFNLNKLYKEIKNELEN